MKIIISVARLVVFCLESQSQSHDFCLCRERWSLSIKGGKEKIQHQPSSSDSLSLIVSLVIDGIARWRWSAYVLECPHKAHICQQLAVELLIADKKRVKKYAINSSTDLPFCVPASTVDLSICRPIFFYGPSFDQHSTRQAAAFER